VAGDQDKISGVDEHAHGLAEDEDRVFSVYGIDQESQAAAHRKVPECYGDNAFLLLLRGEPLKEKAHKKAELPCKTHY